MQQLTLKTNRNAWNDCVTDSILGLGCFSCVVVLFLVVDLILMIDDLSLCEEDVFQLLWLTAVLLLKLFIYNCCLVLSFLGGCCFVCFFLVWCDCC